ncbi:glycosyltransferase [Gammaproteobacteria bacterium]|nr:glycosyltransferase [Gammaproteobacteria bacterium]
MNKKLKVLFVGGFQEGRNGVMGGQLHACRTLIDSEINSVVEFILLDSTMISLPPPPVYIRVYFSFQRILKFCYKLLLKKPDVVLIFTSAGLSFLEKGLMVFIAFIFQTRVIISPRSGLLVDNINNSRFMRCYVKLVFGICDSIICQSITWQKYYSNLTKLPLYKFVVIKNWLDPSYYLQLPAKAIISEPIQVLYLGWIEKNKGIYDLISAVKNNAVLQSNFHFIICGEGSEFYNVTKLLREQSLSHCFELKGWVSSEKKFAELQNADILVLPSHREGLPNAVLEAMASGCCVVASSVGAIPDIIDDKENGFLIERFNIEQLTKTLLELNASTHLIKRTGIAARNTITKHHDIKAAWKKVHATLLQDG